MVEARDGLVGRDGDHVELVDLVEFLGLGERGAGHARELLVEAEVVLEGDRRQRAVLTLDLYALFGLDSLVQSLAVAPTGQHASGELVDDQHLAVAHDVVFVALEDACALSAFSRWRVCSMSS